MPGPDQLDGTSSTTTPSDPTIPSTSPVPASTTTTVVGSPGATSVGDPYLPFQGNGGYDALNYALDLAYNPATNGVLGTATITVEAAQNLSEFSFDFVGPDVSSVVVDGAVAGWRREGPELIVTPRAALPAGTRAEVSVNYAGVLASIETAAGLGSVGMVDAGSVDVVVSQPDGASTWFPANDHPSDKATFDLTIQTPPGSIGVSNGELISSTVQADGSTENVWRVEDPMAPYLFTIGVGPLSLVDHGPVGDVALADWVAPEIAADAEVTLGRTAAMIELFETQFGPYPFDSYGVLAVDATLGFALETQTLSVIGRDFIDGTLAGESVVPHELAHQWFGNSVGLERWSDIWLNEGFASYSEILWLEETTPGFDADAHMRRLIDRFGAELAPPLDPGVVDMFGVHVYVRGALTVHALRRELGDDLFFDVLRTWTSENAGQTVTTDDFRELVARVSGRDLSGLFDAWLIQDGVPAPTW